MKPIYFQNETIKLQKGDKKDSESIAELIYSSGPEAFSFIHGNKENALKFIVFEFSTNFPSFSGNSYAWVGKDSMGRVISSAISYSLFQYYLMSIGSIVNIIMFYQFNCFRVLNRFLFMGKLFKPPKKGEWFLSCFGVAENLRGKGIGQLILIQQMEWARRNNYKCYGLDVAENNPKAKKLYEKMGLIEVKFKQSPTRKVPNAHLMRITL